MIVKKMTFFDFVCEFNLTDGYSDAQLELIFNDIADISTYSDDPYFFDRHEILQNYVPYASILDAAKEIFAVAEPCEETCLELLQAATTVLFNLETENSANKYRDIVVRAF